LAGPAAAKLPGTPVPRGFVGVNLDGPPLDPQSGVSLSSQFDLMRHSGVESVRTTFNWADEQPYASWNDVPVDKKGDFENGVGNVPTDFAETDRIVTGAVQHGLAVFPTVIYAPQWDAAPHSGVALNAPRSNGPYTDYLTTLIHRYGPSGSFWAANPMLPKRPIRMWAIWNEPWLSYYWPTKPFASTYVALLSASHAAIKRADPGAKVALAGMPNASWKAFKDLIGVDHVNQAFDVVDVHPYTEWPSGVIDILTLVRSAMNHAGDGRKTMIAGELGWNSSLHETKNVFDWDTTPTGQARKVRQLLPLLAANRRKLRLIGFYWYTWMGEQDHGGSPWGYAGLVGYHSGNVFTKPALSAFTQAAHAIEG
jgi:hypothetical protein